jgi:hypothetical protein
MPVFVLVLLLPVTDLQADALDEVIAQIRQKTGSGTDPLSQLIQKIETCNVTVKSTATAKPPEECELKSALPTAPPRAAATTQPKKPEAASTPIKFKDEGDVRRYIDCYLPEGSLENPTNKTNITALEKEYWPMIETAAREFQVPRTLLACLLFRESRFNRNATSSTGAIGLGQQMPDNIRYLSNIIGMRPRQDDIQKYQELASLTPRTAQEREDKSYATTRLKNANLSAMWQSYFSRLTSSGHHKGPAPRSLNQTTVRTPAHAIGASALYMRIILLHFNEELDNELVEKTSRENSQFKAWLASAGAYNMGPGAASRLIKRAGVQRDPEAWLRVLSRSNAETRDHILSIRRCAANAASDKEAWLQPAGDRNPRNCMTSDPIPSTTSGAVKK